MPQPNQLEGTSTAAMRLGVVLTRTSFPIEPKACRIVRHLRPKCRRLAASAPSAVIAAQRACKPITDKRGTIEYRTKVAGVLARRAAAIAFERAAARA